jgi:hypothetical protein
MDTDDSNGGTPTIVAGDTDDGGLVLSYHPNNSI